MAESAARKVFSVIDSWNSARIAVTGACAATLRSAHEASLRLAEENGAEEEVLAKIRRMPDREYGSMAEVMRAFGETDRT